MWTSFDYLSKVESKKADQFIGGPQSHIAGPKPVFAENFGVFDPREVNFLHEMSLLS